jgi:hypothetical protein
MAVRVSERVEAFHEALILSGNEGKIILRSDVEELFMKKWKIGLSASRLYIDTGRGLGLWRLVGEPKGGRGSLERGLAFGPSGLLILPRKSSEESEIPL